MTKLEKMARKHVDVIVLGTLTENTADMLLAVDANPDYQEWVLQEFGADWSVMRPIFEKIDFVYDEATYVPL